MEITGLKSNGESWWTIGFDLFTEQDHSFFDRLIEIYSVLQIEVDLKKEWSYGILVDYLRLSSKANCIFSGVLKGIGPKGPYFLFPLDNELE